MPQQRRPIRRDDILDESKLPVATEQFYPFFSRKTLKKDNIEANKEIIFFTKNDTDDEFTTNMPRDRELQANEKMKVTHLGFSIPKGILKEDWELLVSKDAMIELKEYDTANPKTLPIEWIKQLTSIRGKTGEKVEIITGGLTKIPDEMQLSAENRFKVSLKSRDGNYSTLSEDIKMTMFLVGPSKRY